MDLRIGTQTIPPSGRLVMAIVNRTPDSFFDSGAAWDMDDALDRVDQVVEEGADILDIGGVKAGPGTDVSVAEEIRRVVPFVERVRARYPDVAISVDTWRAEVARAACQAGCDLLNDTWGGVDPRLFEVASEFDAALVCAHTGGQAVRTRPFRVEYEDLMTDVTTSLRRLAERAEGHGVARDKIIVDPAHDFGKNTWHSLEVTRHLDQIVQLGWPVLVSVSNKDFIGESLGRPVPERSLGTLAATVVTAWLGARIHRVHDVAQAKEVLEMTSVIAGDLAPLRAVRGLA